MTANTFPTFYFRASYENSRVGGLIQRLNKIGSYIEGKDGIMEWLSPKKFPPYLVRLSITSGNTLSVGTKAHLEIISPYTEDSEKNFNVEIFPKQLRDLLKDFEFYQI